MGEARQSKGFNRFWVEGSGFWGLGLRAVAKKGFRAFIIGAGLGVMTC